MKVRSVQGCFYYNYNPPIPHPPGHLRWSSNQFQSTPTSPPPPPQSPRLLQEPSIAIGIEHISPPLSPLPTTPPPWIFKMKIQMASTTSFLSLSPSPPSEILVPASTPLRKRPGIKQAWYIKQQRVGSTAWHVESRFNELCSSTVNHK